MINRSIFFRNMSVSELSGFISQLPFEIAIRIDACESARLHDTGIHPHTRINDD